MNLLVIGIDPGTTTGYAALDIDGNVQEISSSKDLSLSSLISSVIRHGKPVIVGCDKGSVPSFVEKFASKTGSVVCCPGEDVSVIEKKSLTSAFSVSNDHERDALASAILAYKHHSGLISKISSFVKKNKKQHLREKIAELVIRTEGLNISEALRLLEQPEEDREEVVRKVVDKKLTEKDFIALYTKLNQLRRENRLLHIHNRNIKKQLAAKKTKKVKVLDKNAKKRLKFKDRTISALDQKLDAKEKEISSLNSEVNTLMFFLSSLDQHVLLKKLSTLGYDDFRQSNKIINIQQDDILLVNNLSVSSPKTLAELREKVNIIVHKKPVTKKLAKSLPFILVDASRLSIKEHSYFALVRKDSLDSVKDAKTMLSKILQSYRDERVCPK